MAPNNQQSSFSLTENRLLQTASVPSGGGAAIALANCKFCYFYQLMYNHLSVIMEKLILLLILQLEYGPDNSILNRSITTNANLNNGEVLVLVWI